MSLCQSQHERKGDKKVPLGLSRSKNKATSGILVLIWEQIHVLHGRGAAKIRFIDKEMNQNLPSFPNSQLTYLVHLLEINCTPNCWFSSICMLFCNFSTCVHAWTCDPPSTVTVARAVRTGMVNSEQVYSPSSDSCTSEMVMESSVGVERCSWIRLSLKAAERHRTSVIRHVLSEILIDMFGRFIYSIILTLWAYDL